MHRPHGQINDDEAVGLAALLGSALLDIYFRVSSGNTQVNAAEIRALPLPPQQSLMTLGAEIRRPALDSTEVDKAVTDILRVPRSLIEMMGDDVNGKS